MFPPRYEHEEYDENLDEWTERGFDEPVFYTCKFCPAEGETPDHVDHNIACPVAREVSA